MYGYDSYLQLHEASKMRMFQDKLNPKYKNIIDVQGIAKLKGLVDVAIRVSGLVDKPN